MRYRSNQICPDKTDREPQARFGGTFQRNSCVDSGCWSPSASTDALIASRTGEEHGMTGTDTETLSELPPSAKLVYKVLDHEEEPTQKEIVEETRLSARTVRYALERLESIDIVEQDIYFADARQNLYRVVESNAASD